jgi:hypothetical protein
MKTPAGTLHAAVLNDRKYETNEILSQVETADVESKDKVLFPSVSDIPPVSGFSHVKIAVFLVSDPDCNSVHHSNFLRARTPHFRRSQILQCKKLQLTCSCSLHAGQAKGTVLGLRSAPSRYILSGGG